MSHKQTITFTDPQASYLKREAQQLGISADAMDGLAPAKGILLGLLLSAILWVMIGSLAWWLCH
jgi:hypothetical protein